MTTPVFCTALQAVSEPLGVDWSDRPLPPCTDAVRVAVDSTLRHARLARAYYEPETVVADAEHPGRERRIAEGQVVVVAADGTVLATWRVGSRPSMRETLRRAG